MLCHAYTNGVMDYKWIETNTSGVNVLLEDHGGPECQAFMSTNQVFNVKILTLFLTVFDNLSHSWNGFIPCGNHSD